MAQLDSAVAHRAMAWQTARDEAARDPWTRVRSVLEPLKTYSDGVKFRKRAPDPEEERALVVELVDRVTEQGLTFRPVEAGAPGVIEVWDPAPDEVVAETWSALQAAKSERDTFARENAEELEAEARRAEMERLREAMAGDDPEAVKAALAS